MFDDLTKAQQAQLIIGNWYLKNSRQAQEYETWYANMTHVRSHVNHGQIVRVRGCPVFIDKQQLAKILESIEAIWEAGEPIIDLVLSNPGYWLPLLGYSDPEEQALICSPVHLPGGIRMVNCRVDWPGAIVEPLNFETEGGFGLGEWANRLAKSHPALPILEEIGFEINWSMINQIRIESVLALYQKWEKAQPKPHLPDIFYWGNGAEPDEVLQSNLLVFEYPQDYPEGLRMVFACQEEGWQYPNPDLNGGLSYHGIPVEVVMRQRKTKSVAHLLGGKDHPVAKAAADGKILLLDPFVTAILDSKYIGVMLWDNGICQKLGLPQDQISLIRRGIPKMLPLETGTDLEQVLSLKERGVAKPKTGASGAGIDGLVLDYEILEKHQGESVWQRANSILEVPLGMPGSIVQFYAGVDPYHNWDGFGGVLARVVERLPEDSLDQLIKINVGQVGAKRRAGIAPCGIVS